MQQRSVRLGGRGWLSGAVALSMLAGCMGAPGRVSPTLLGKEGMVTIRAQAGVVGAPGKGGFAAPGTASAAVPLAAPIISNNGVGLKGSVRVPASIISHNGGNIVSNNGGGIVSNNGGGIISHNGGNIISHNGGNLRIAQVPLAFTTVRLKDAAGNPVKDDKGQALTTKTDANGNYAFSVDVKGRNLVIEADVEGQTGTLKSLLPKDGLEAGKGLDVDLSSTLTLAYILDQYVKGDLVVFERLPKDIEAKARLVTEEAIVSKQIALPTTLEAGAIVAKVEEVRKAAPEVDQVFEEIKKLLVIAGIVKEGDGMRAVDVSPGVVGAVLPDGAGNFYVFSQSEHNVWRIDGEGILHTVVPMGRWGYVEQPTGWTTPGYTSGAGFDAAGNLVLADTYNNRVVRITKAGQVTVVAGTGVAGFGGDGGAATSAQLNRPSGLVLDASGAIYVSDTENHRVRKITPDGTIQTVLGDGVAGFAGDGGPALSARLNRPQGLALGKAAELFVADFGNNRVRVMPSTGSLATLPGEIHSPIVLAVETNGDVLCLSHHSAEIFRTTQAGPAAEFPLQFSLPGIDFTPLFSRVMTPFGEKMILDSNVGAVNFISRNGKADRLMGMEPTGVSSITQFEGAYGLVVDKDENAYVSDLIAKRIVKISPSGKTQLIAGNGTNWSNAVHANPTGAGIGMVSGLGLTASGQLMFATIGSYTSINEISGEGSIVRRVGSGKVNYQKPPSGESMKVELANVFSLAEMSDGRLAFALPDNGQLCVVEENGTVGYLLNPELVSSPGCLKVDRQGLLYFWERGHRQISRFTPQGPNKVFGREDVNRAIGDQVVKALAFDSRNRLYIATERMIVRMDAPGVWNVIAGQGAAILGGSSRDDGLTAVADICFSPAGHLFVLEAHQLKKVHRDSLDLL